MVKGLIGFPKEDLPKIPFFFSDIFFTNVLFNTVLMVTFT